VITSFSNTNKSVIAIVDDEGVFWGMIYKEQANKIAAAEEKTPTMTAAEIAIIPNHTVQPYEAIESVVRKFEESDVWYLPVVDTHQKYVGFASRFKFLVRYRQLLKNLS
jgi:CIC family chloride channel protein